MQPCFITLDWKHIEPTVILAKHINLIKCQNEYDANINVKK